MTQRSLAPLAVRALPKRALTRVAGRLASARVPVPLRTPLYSAYAAAVGANLDESGAPLCTFETFNDFFGRPLVEGRRAWAESAVLASPADGRLDACGQVLDGRMIQAKGVDYSVEELVCDPQAGQVFEGGHYATVYLSPADYHRVHAPAALGIDRVVVEPGELWPVNGLSVPFVDGLFRRNERVVFRGRLESGAQVAIVMVAATVVGNIVVNEPRVGFGRHHERREFPLAPEWRVEPGHQIGTFLLGSTVIVVVEARDRQLCLVPQPGERVQLGQALYA